MAFVLQDDARGSKAISTSVNIGKSAVGETLGVWGAAGGANQILNNQLTPGSGAIQNSLALEYDTFQNSTAASSTC